MTNNLDRIGEQDMVSQIHRLHNPMVLDERPTYERVREFYIDAETQRNEGSDYVIHHRSYLDNMLKRRSLDDVVKDNLQNLKQRLQKEIQELKSVQDNE